MTHTRCSSGTNTLRLIAEELREYTAMKYAGDCKCGKCQLVPRELVERLYHTLNSAGVTPSVAQASSDAADAARYRFLKKHASYYYPEEHNPPSPREFGIEWNWQDGTPERPDMDALIDREIEEKRVLAEIDDDEGASLVSSTHQPIEGPARVEPVATGEHLPSPPSAARPTDGELLAVLNAAIVALKSRDQSSFEMKVLEGLKAAMACLEAASTVTPTQREGK